MPARSAVMNPFVLSFMTYLRHSCGSLVLRPVFLLQGPYIAFSVMIYPDCAVRKTRPGFLVPLTGYANR